MKQAAAMMRASNKTQSTVRYLISSTCNDHITIYTGDIGESHSSQHESAGNTFRPSKEVGHTSRVLCSTRSLSIQHCARLGCVGRRDRRGTRAGCRPRSQNRGLLVVLLPLRGSRSDIAQSPDDRVVCVNSRVSPPRIQSQTYLW